MVKLDWPDLLIQDFSEIDTHQWLEPWKGMVTGELAPLALSRFGSWFFLRKQGHVEMLDVLTGALTRVADSNDAFIGCVNTPTWQEENLLSLLVHQLHTDGVIAAGHQCYVLAPHPRLGGPNPMAGQAVQSRFVLPVDAVVCQSLCAQSVAATGGLQQS